MEEKSERRRGDKNFHRRCKVEDPTADHTMSIGLLSDVDVKSRTYDVDANMIVGGGKVCRSIQANLLS